MHHRRCVFGGEKAPAGARLDAPSLESACFMYFKNKGGDFRVTQYRRCCLGGKKDPAGAHLDTTSLQSTCSMHLRQKIRDSLLMKNTVLNSSVVEKKTKNHGGLKRAGQ